MTNNYFNIERDGKYVEKVIIKYEGEIAFEDVMNMSYEEIKTYDKIGEFVTGMMDAANAYFQEGDSQTLIVLVGQDDVFIWSILIGPGDNDDELRYSLIDWRKDGNKYRYEKI